ncbi:MAG: DegV family protein [Candidatus Scatomorpha sp.]|jgi:DegV family protein with EDD domain
MSHQDTPDESGVVKSVVITADSTCDLTPELLERFQIKTIPLTIIMGEKRFLDGVDLTPDDIYKYYYENGSLPQTAAPSIPDLYDFFESFTKEGYEVVHLDISSELSAIFNIASFAAGELDGVYVIDSRMLSTGLGLLAIEAAECRDRGMGAREIAEHLNALKSKVSASFVLDTLEFIWKGGRCSGIALFGANVMKIRPALKLINGKIEVFKKYRGKMENVYRQYIKDQFAERKIRPAHVFLTEAGEIPPEVIERLLELVKEESGCIELHHTRAGCTISSHCGPKSLGVLFIEE